MKPITCVEADRRRATLVPLSSLTNYIAGEVIDPSLPHHTATTWGTEFGDEIMREVLSPDGCEHWLLDPVPRETDSPEVLAT